MNKTEKLLGENERERERGKKDSNSKIRNEGGDVTNSSHIKTSLITQMKGINAQKDTKYKNKNKSLTRPITHKMIIFMILKLLTKKISGPDSFTGEFYETYKKN